MQAMTYRSASTFSKAATRFFGPSLRAEMRLFTMVVSVEVVVVSSTAQAGGRGFKNNSAINYLSAV